MNERSNDNENRGGAQEVLSPNTALSEPTLAIDLAMGEIDKQIATAHKFPRSIDTFIKKVSTLALYNEEAAANCVYSLPRGGKPIIGASIGFANIVCQCWGNNRVGSRIVYVDRREKSVVAEGIFMDLEVNHQTLAPVNRRIVDKHGRLFSDDMILVTGMAAASIARRNAILNAVPRALWYPIWNEALAITRGTIETFAENKEKALKAFAQFGVKPEQVFMVLGLKGEPDLNFEHLPTLRGMYQALRDGSVTVEEMFDPRRMTGTGFEQVVNPLGDAEADEETAGEATGDQPADGEGGEPGGEAEGAGEAQADPKAATPVKTQPKTQPKPATTPKPAAAAKPATAPKPAQPAAAPKPAAAAAPKPAAQAKAPEPKAMEPRDSEQYLHYARAYIAEATSASELANRWKGERQLRTTCGVMEDDFTAILSEYQARLEQLKG